MRFIILLTIFICRPLFGCSDFHWEWSAEKWIEGSDAIYHGVVVSISLDESSIYDGETDPLLNAVSLRGQKQIKLKVSETLKGTSQKVVEATLPECIGGLAEFREFGLLFKVGDVWHIKSVKGPNEDEIARAIVNRLTKIQHRSGVKP